MKLVTVYGSLLSGLGNWAWCLDREGATLLGEHVLEERVGMISLGGFPGLIHTDDVHKIHTETYQVTDEIYRDIERLEGFRKDNPEHGMYSKMTIDTPWGKSEIYMYNGSAWNDNLLLPNADGIVNWKEHHKSKVYGW